MKIYQDLFFRGHQKDLMNLLPAIEERLSDGWARSRADDADSHRAGLGPMYCFECAEKEDRPASKLWLATSKDGYLYVSNIIPNAFHDLTYDQYNAILQEFYTWFAQPAAYATNVRTELSKSDLKIEDFLSATSLSLLRSFSGLANRSILHPLDSARWNQFVTSAHREHAPLNESTLVRWLVEEDGWPRDKAIDLATEYGRGRRLLETYESVQV